jgi:hypothetical protein
MILNYENPVEVTIRSGETGDVKYHYDGHNAISDDILGQYARIYFTSFAASSSVPYCFILPQVSTEWTGFTFDRTNPWAPNCITANNFVDNSAQPQWQPRQGVGGFTGPSNTVTGKAKLFFQWSDLPTDFNLRAIGLTGWQSDTFNGDIGDYAFGAGNTVNLQPTVFVPQTLLVLPSSVLVHGRNGGAGTPDVLQISYFLSIVGTS